MFHIKGNSMSIKKKSCVMFYYCPKAENSETERQSVLCFAQQCEIFCIHNSVCFRETKCCFVNDRVIVFHCVCSSQTIFFVSPLLRKNL